jgi:acyl-CoA thioesterase-1
MSRVIVILCLLGTLLATPVRSAEASAPVILVFGNSISAGYGIRVEQGWVSLLAKRLAGEGYGIRVVNASVSGETTAGGLARLPRALDLNKPRIVLIELGGNDGLRGLPLAATRDNLGRMVALAQQRGCQVLLLGIRIPPNYGARYTAEFEGGYRDLAIKYGVPLVPFLLENVAGKGALMQPDGIHPNEQGQPILLDNVWRKLLPLARTAVRGG